MWRNRNVWIVIIGEFVVGLGLWAAECCFQAFDCSLSGVLLLI